MKVQLLICFSFFFSRCKIYVKRLIKRAEFFVKFKEKLFTKFFSRFDSFYQK